MPHKNITPETYGARTFAVVVRELWPDSYNNNTEIRDSHVWLVPRGNSKKRVRLPVPSVRKENPFSFDRFVVSPDERVILAARKRYSGANDVFVFHQRGGPLHYVLADRLSLNDRIGRKYGRPHDPSDKDHDYNDPSVEFVHFEAWKPNGRDAALACHYGPRNKGVNYVVMLNTHTGALSHYKPMSKDSVLRMCVLPVGNGVVTRADMLPTERVNLALILQAGERGQQ